MKAKVAVWSARLLLALSSVFLGACGDMDQGVMRQSPPIDVLPIADKESYADSFPLLDYRTGEEGRPVAAPSNKAPFGVMIDFYSRQQLVLCTVTHFTSQQALVNAHCLEKDPTPENYYLVFYDSSGNHSYLAVRSFGYVGDTRSDDVAILNLDPQDSAGWDTLDAALTNTDSLINRGLGTGDIPVTVWTFDPLTDHPNLARNYGGRQGGVFRPKECTGFRTQPVIEMINLASNAVPYPPTPVDPQKHIFLDRCSGLPMPGNSGSLITERQDITHAIGAFHWIITLQDAGMIRQYKSFDYTGSSGAKVALPPTNPVQFYYVGTDLNDVRRDHPGSL